MVWMDRCVMLFGCVIDVFLMFDFFRGFFDFQLEKRDRWIAFFLACCGMFGINLIGKTTANLVLIPILMWVFVSAMFESKRQVRAVYFVIAYIVMMGAEFLYAILSKTTAQLVLKTGVVPISEYGWQVAAIKLLNFILFVILKQSSSKSHSKMENKLFLSYLWLPVTTFGLMIILFYSGVDLAGHAVLRVLMTLFLILMSIGNMVLFYTFQQHSEERDESTRQQIELHHKNAEIKQLSKVAEMDDDYRETIHNITHSLKVIQQLVSKGEREQVDKVIEELTGKMIHRKIHEYCKNRMINTILSEYAERAEKQEIQFDVYVEPGCNLHQINDIDVVSLIGNLLDNAFEAAEKMEDAVIEFRLYAYKKMSILRVINDYVDEPVIKNEKILTIKKEKGVHGIGIKSIERTAQKYNGNFDYYTEEKKFHAVVMIPNT